MTAQSLARQLYLHRPLLEATDVVVKEGGSRQRVVKGDRVALLEPDLGEGQDRPSSGS